MSRKILELAREQADEVGRELGEDEWDDEEEDNIPESSRPRGHDMDSDMESDDDFGADVSAGEEEAELEIDPEDHATLDALAPGEGPAAGGQTLADIIFAKMAAAPAVEDDGPPDPKQGLNPKVVEVYAK